MTREFKLMTEFVPGIGFYIGWDKSQRYRGIAILLPFMSLRLLVRCKDKDEI